MTKYDAIVVGGGVGGCALADQLARDGHAVLVLERETRFKDRVRGENILPWGVAAARRLGIYETLMNAGARPAPNWVVYSNGHAAPARDLRATTPGGNAMLNVYHPNMQEALVVRARAGGATMKRGATVIGIDAGSGRAPSVTYELNREWYTATARIVVGADGRASRMRAWGGFEIRRSPDRLTVAGMLVDGSHVPDGGAYLCMAPGVATFWAPLGNGRARAYVVYPSVDGRRGLSGTHRVKEFFDAVQSVGTPTSWTETAVSIGPLAEFDGAPRWVPTPARHGVALIGDAAAASDPSWGSGLSLTLLDVEHLANALRGTSDWDAAIVQYAQEHDVYFDAIHRIHEWMTDLSWTPGPVADERRERVIPRWLTQPDGFPDLVGLGPFGPSDERARRLILGLD